MKLDENCLLLYAVTDRSWLKDRTLYQQVEEALRGGVTCVQLREKDMAEDEFLSEATDIKTLCNKYKIPFIINDNVALAIKCGADGVHVGQSDMQSGEVRRLIGKDMILGVSAATVAQAKLAEENGADYLGVGAVFPTATKADADAVSLDTLRDICEAVQIPVVAIGGITKANINQLGGTGIAGCALVSAIFAEPDIQAGCLSLRKLLEETLL